MRSLANFPREVKAKDVAISIGTNTSGGIQLMNGLAPGVAFDQRVGRHVRARRLDLDFTVHVTESTGPDQFTRYLVVLDCQPNGSALTIADVLTTVDVRAMPNLSNQARFKILRDEVVYLSASAEAASGVHRKFSIGLPFTTTFYTNASAGTVADIATNSLYFIAVGSTAAFMGLVSGNARFRYTDD